MGCVSDWVRVHNEDANEVTLTPKLLYIDGGIVAETHVCVILEQDFEGLKQRKI